MPTYDYVAIDRAGRTLSGRIAGADLAAARRTVEKRGLVLTQINAGVAAPRATQSNAKTSHEGRLGGKPLALMTRQLATLLAVAPMEEALRTLSLQIEGAKQRRILDRLHEGVLEGLRLSDAMARCGRAFPPTFRAMVSAGETSGALIPVLERLADLLEKREETSAKISAALVYPIVLAVVALGVITALMTFVIPKVVDQFNTSGAQLPPLTSAIIAISTVMAKWGWLIGLGLVGAILAFLALLATPAFRYGFDAFLLRLPVVGRMLRDVEAASLARTLSTMIASGLPVLEALQLSAASVNNAVIRKAVKDMAVSVSEGAGLSAAMRRTNAFPPLLVYLAANGEGGAKLDLMLERAADYLEREFRTATAIALSLLEPAIIVIMGGVVCLVILSILLPILQINTLASVG